MRPSAFNLTKQGASHIKKNKECQDASISFSNEKYAIAIVCDGHGGDDYVRSATGASLACNVALENILYFVHAADSKELAEHHDKMLKTLEASIIAGWSEAIYEDYAQRPFTDEELSALSEKAKKKYLEGKIDSAYGTTLIAVVLTTEYWFGIHIGDGKCVAINRESKFGQPIPWDEKCFLNATTSLCDSNAINNFRHFFSYKLPAAIFIGSDGIDDCFSNNEQLYNLYRTVLYSFASTDFDMAKADLEDYLPRLSAKGSGDDVSIAAVMDLDIIGELKTIKDYDREKEKARVEENARIEAERSAEERRRIDAEYAEKQRQREEAQRAEEARRRQKSIAPKQRYCEKCGEKLHVGAMFCGACGEQVRNGLPTPLKPLSPLAEESVDIAGPELTEESTQLPVVTPAQESPQPKEDHHESTQLYGEQDSEEMPAPKESGEPLEDLSVTTAGCTEITEFVKEEGEIQKKDIIAEDEIAEASPAADEEQDLPAR